MIDLFTWGTLNSRKISIMLEETGLAYRVHLVDIGAGEQHEPDFLAISPNNKVPAIVDHELDGGPRKIFESGAILIYLAEKTGRLLPNAGVGRTDVLQWLMWQMSGLGPMFGQYYHFARMAKDEIPYAIDRFDQEMQRLLTVMNTRLGEAPYLGGNYSIADIAAFDWVRNTRKLRDDELDWSRFPHIDRWLEDVGARPAVQRGMRVPSDREPYQRKRGEATSAGD
ncbi:MAG: glutathione S-transferase N-terminal domain-containing protein [Pseudomonadota bacterium]